MADTDLLARVLQACSQSAPAPLFPAEFSTASGIDRSQLDDAIDRLRLNGYVQIADWAQGKGQGYTLTAAGAEALTRPTELRQPAVVRETTPERTFTPRTWERGEIIRAALVEPAPPVVTMVLLFANLLMFAIGLAWALMRGVAVDGYLLGANSIEMANLHLMFGSLSTRHVILADQWWRLLTHQFVHDGVLHLALNMFALYNIGPLLESLWGSKRYLALYLVAGVIGGAAVLMTGRNAVGASGAICGLLGSFAVWLWLNRDCLPEHVTAAWTSSIITSLMLMVVISLPIGPLKRVSWEGHLGGVVGGALFSIPLHFQRFGVPWQRVVSWLALPLIPAAAIWLGYYAQTRKHEDLLDAWLQQQFDERFRDSEAYLLNRRNRFIVPALQDPADAWIRDAGFVADFQKACAESVEKLRPLRAELANWNPGKDKAAQEARNIRAYFDAWNGLFETLDRHLQHPEAWNPARRRGMDEKDKAVFGLREPLEQNSILPRFPKLVPQKERPAAPAKPRGNIA